jgi:trans-aconitate methyltransferase
MQAIELVSFRLLASATSQDFLAANVEINQWLASHPGFLRRELAEGEDGTWLDVVVWKTMEDAHAAAAAMEATANDFAAMRMINPASISMQYADLKLAA